ncbi:MAG: HAD family hydrolase [Anaerolineae bacterium]|jgi:putative hydrolase of the HAD superfamily|nr:HAD family hydrolase [Anaerolineae bacterium]
MSDGLAGQGDLLLAFDADDTLWHSENLYHAAQAQFRELMTSYADESTAMATLHRVEVANLPPYGFGVKAFILSMIEAAVELSGGKVTAAEIGEMLAAGKEMLAAEVELLDGVADTVARLSADYPLMVITKGDLGHQASKLERSGLAAHFRYVEIVTDKTAEVYRNIFAKHGIAPQQVVMVGNSLKSDVIPVLELGGWGVHIPYRLTWAHEHAELPADLATKYREIERLDELPALLREMR